jgi:flagellar biogenesis protein FliO
MVKKNINNKKSQTMTNDILMRSIKIIDIGYITVLYITISLVCATITDKAMGEFDEKYESKKSLWQLTLEFVLVVWFYGVLIYIVRNLIELVPFPLNNYYGFSHKKVKELSSAMVFTFTFVLFSNYLNKKLQFYYKVIKANT